jgi:hypothetical protein
MRLNWVGDEETWPERPEKRQIALRKREIPRPWRATLDDLAMMMLDGVGRSELTRLVHRLVLQKTDMKGRR